MICCPSYKMTCRRWRSRLNISLSSVIDDEISVGSAAKGEEAEGAVITRSVTTVEKSPLRIGARAENDVMVADALADVRDEMEVGGGGEGEGEGDSVCVDNAEAETDDDVEVEVGMEAREDSVINCEAENDDEVDIGGKAEAEAGISADAEVKTDETETAVEVVHAGRDDVWLNCRRPIRA